MTHAFLTVLGAVLEPLAALPEGSVPIRLELEDWKRIEVPRRDFPDFVEKDGGWVVKTEDEAGGLAALFASRLPVNGGRPKFSWRWQVRRFPQTETVLPLDEKNDDYALRVGFLLSDGRNSLPVPGEVSRILERESLKVSNVLFYVAVPSGTISGCGVSAYDDRIFLCLIEAGPEPELCLIEAGPEPELCLIEAGPEPERVTVNLAADLERVRKLPSTRELGSPIEVVGAWVFADSDNSETKSRASFEAFEILG